MPLSHNTHADNTRHHTTLIAQGPALYFYNNASFSEADFRNLASIGQSSKLAKLNTTGRFGLGFNATYHYTYTLTTHSRTCLSQRCRNSVANHGDSTTQRPAATREPGQHCHVRPTHNLRPRRHAWSARHSHSLHATRYCTFRLTTPSSITQAHACQQTTRLAPSPFVISSPTSSPLSCSLAATCRPPSKALCSVFHSGAVVLLLLLWLLPTNTSVCALCLPEHQPQRVPVRSARPRTAAPR